MVFFVFYFYCVMGIQISQILNYVQLLKSVCLLSGSVLALSTPWKNRQVTNSFSKHNYEINIDRGIEYRR